MTYMIRPVSDRTMFGGKHRRSQFDTPWPKTERQLLSELGHLGGKNIIIEVDVREVDIRLDGRIKANARPASPGVRLAFDSKHGPLTYATDQFNHWQDNVRAIALGLEALRAVDRYGITKNAEQYAGYKALGVGSGTTAMGGMTRDTAYEVLYAWLPDDFTGNEASMFRLARAAAHPDRQNGDRTGWDQIERAGKVLGLLS